MTNVSKRHLDSGTKKQLRKQFAQLFASADEKHIVSMFDALFTEAEMVMFVKRLAIALLIAEDYSTYAIAKRLKVSDATVRTILKQAKAGKFDPITKITRSSTFDKKRFWQTVEVLLRGGLPPQGKDRWQWLDKYQ